MRYITQARSRGVEDADIAQALGVALKTVRTWGRDIPKVSVEKETEFQRVAVVEHPTELRAGPEVQRSHVVVRGRCGLRIEGISMNELAQLMRALG